MNDLINRAEAIEAMKAVSDSICEQQAVDALYELPSADTVEVVRCKDCVYWKYRANYKGDEWGACLFLEDVEHWTEDTAFCSFGERSEE